MHVKLFGRGSNRLVAASFAEGRIAIARLCDHQAIADVLLPESSGLAFGISEDCTRLVTAYYNRPGIDVWEVPSGMHLCRIGKYTASQLLVDRTATKALLWRKYKGVVNLLTGTFIRIPNLETLYGAMIDAASNAVWVTLNKRRLVGRFCFASERYEAIDHGDDESVWAIRISPTDKRVILLRNHGRRRGSAACYSAIGERPLWVRPLAGDDVSSEGSFTGDGTRFLISAITAGCVISLESQTGAEMQRFPFKVTPVCPLDGPRAMLSGGRVFDASAGTIVDWVNQSEWWREAGLGSRHLRG